MPILYAGPGGYVSISSPKLFEKIRGLPKIIRAGAIEAAKEIAQKHKEKMETGLRSGSFAITPLAESTKRTRFVGKKAGATPAKPIRRNTNPLLYTGNSLKALRVTMRSEAVLELMYPEGATWGYSRGKMRDVSSFHEHGFQRKGRYTARQLAYLHILFRKGGRKNKSAREAEAGKSGRPARVGISYRSKTPRRPVWEMTRKLVKPLIPGLVQKGIRRSLRNAGFRVKG